MTPAIPHPILEAEAVQIAYRVVESYGGDINFYRLAKILYLIERETWIATGSPAMGGTYFSLEDGPMVSETTNAANNDLRSLPAWGEHLKTVPSVHGGSEVRTVKPPGRGMISDAVLRIVDDVVKKTRRMKKDELKKLCHDLGEFKEPPKGGRIPIEAEEILEAGGWDTERIEAEKRQAALWGKLEAVLC
jgi:hypothetical protein